MPKHFGLLKIFFFSLIIITLLPLKILSQKIQVDEGETPEYYANIVKLYAPSEDAFIALQYLAAPSIFKHDWKKAAKFYEDNKFKFPGYEDRFDKILEIINSPDKNIRLTNMGGNINSLGSEYSPVISPDMKRLYFTGRDREDNIGGEDIFISQYVNVRWIIS